MQARLSRFFEPPRHGESCGQDTMGRNKVWLLPRRNCRPRCGILIATTEKIGKSHSGLSTINTRINWAKTQGDLELLDGGITLPKVDVDPPATPGFVPKPDLDPDLPPARAMLRLRLPPRRQHTRAQIQPSQALMDRPYRAQWPSSSQAHGLFNNVLPGNIGAPAVGTFPWLMQSAASAYPSANSGSRSFAIFVSLSASMRVSLVYL